VPDHKFDPNRPQEYYQLYPFFHNVAESGLDGRKGNATPLLKLPTAEQQATLDRMSAAIAGIERRLDEPWPELDVAQAAWEATSLRELRGDWTVLDPSTSSPRGGRHSASREDRSIEPRGNPAQDVYQILAPAGLDAIKALRVEALPDEALEGKGPGRSAVATRSSARFRIALATAEDPEREGPVKIEPRVPHGQESPPSPPRSTASPRRAGRSAEPGEPHTAVFELERPLSIGCCELLAVTLVFRSEHPRTRSPVPALGLGRGRPARHPAAPAKL